MTNNKDTSIHRKKVKHYNETGHAHELTFSTNNKYPFFKDEKACSIFLEELELARTKYDFELWAYVIMSTHCHLLIWPRNENYNISPILSAIKGKCSTRYGKELKITDPGLYKTHCVKKGDRLSFRLWRPGPGFDRNTWLAKPVHNMIKYIENNPVRAGLVSSPIKWKWSSAYARKTLKGVIPDQENIPILYK